MRNYKRFLLCFRLFFKLYKSRKSILLLYRRNVRLTECERKNESIPYQNKKITILLMLGLLKLNAQTESACISDCRLLQRTQPNVTAEWNRTIAVCYSENYSAVKFCSARVRVKHLVGATSWIAAVILIDLGSLDINMHMSLLISYYSRLRTNSACK